MKNYLVFINEDSEILVKDLYDFLEDAMAETPEPARSKLAAVFNSFDFFSDEKPDPAPVKAIEAEILEAFKNIENLDPHSDVIASYHFTSDPETAMKEAFEFWEESEGFGPDENVPAPSPF